MRPTQHLFPSGNAASALLYVSNCVASLVDSPPLLFSDAISASLPLYSNTASALLPSISDVISSFNDARSSLFSLRYGFSVLPLMNGLNMFFHPGLASLLPSLAFSL